jgi:MoaA/NifB/PqqE/SkfB family radical SAM enzyme
MSGGRINFDRYAVVPVWYHCDSKCTICMLEQQMGRLPTVSLQSFQRIVAKIVNHAQHDGFILSGAEVTTFAPLEDYIRFVRSLDWFRTIQIQTNGRRLAKEDYARRLVEAGVNEFFISFHGTEHVHDAITGVKGSFREALEAVGNLAAVPGVNLLSNTVFSTQNAASLPALVEFLLTLPVSEIQLWNYFPMAPTDGKGLVANLRELLALLPRLNDVVAPSGKWFVLKGFPECLAIGGAAVFDNVFPLNIIDDAFWRCFHAQRFGVCVHKPLCAAEHCYGLCDAYREKFGDEGELLKPKGARP